MTAALTALHPQSWQARLACLLQESAGCRTSYPALQAVSMVIMLAYLSYLVAEHFGCSGIVAIFTCAVVMSHYAMYNVPRATRRATRHTAEVFSYLCEGAIFLYVGLDTIDPVTWEVGVFYWFGSVCWAIGPVSSGLIIGCWDQIPSTLGGGIAVMSSLPFGRC